MEKSKKALEALRNDLHHVPMTDRLASAFRHLDAALSALSALEGSKPKEQGAEPYAWTVRGTRQMYFGEYAESDARMEAKKIGGTAVAFPLFRQDQGAEPVALAQEVMKVWNEDGDGGEIQKKTPIAWYRVTRLAEEILAGKCIPTSREKAMEEVGDAMAARLRAISTGSGLRVMWELATSTK